MNDIDIQLTCEQVEIVMVNSLKDAYDLHHPNSKQKAKNNFYIDEDLELCKSIESVLRYYMVHREFEEWLKEYEND